MRKAMKPSTEHWHERIPLLIRAGVLLTIVCAGITGVVSAQVVSNGPLPSQPRQVVDPCGPGVSSVPSGTAFKVCMTHDGLNTIDYTMTVDRPLTATDVIATKPVSALVNGAVLFDVAAQTAAGAYTVKVCARGPAVTTCSDVVPFTVAAPPPPPPPTKPGLRIIGTGTIAGQRVPVVIDVDRIEGLEAYLAALPRGK